MRVVLDTNVLVSGIFFGGVPGQIIDAWSDERLSLVLTPEIIEEYARVGHAMAAKYPGGRKAFTAMLEILTVHSPVLAAASPRLASMPRSRADESHCPEAPQGSGEGS